MKKIIIEASTYIYGNKKYKQEYTRLVVGSENGGHNVTGPKFGDFPSHKEIKVELTLNQAKELLVELERLILRKEQDE